MTLKRSIPVLLIIQPLLCSLLCVAADKSNDIAGFVGTWKEDESKRIGSFANLRFRNTATGGLEELRGPEAKPLVQPIKFGTQPYAVDDGTASIAWKQIDAIHFERQLFEGGKLISTRKIEISPDGGQLTEMFRQKTTDGKENVRTTVFRRMSAGPKGLAGTWKMESLRNSEPPQQKIELVGSASLRVAGPFTGYVMWNFDGNPSPVIGEGVIPGMTETAKLVNNNSIEVTLHREGVLIGKRTFVLSLDRKVLTVTMTVLGTDSKPTVTVYDKQ